MTASVTFETATIADAVSKAARIAPSKGAAFDKAAGIALDIDAMTTPVTLRATNLEVTYLEEVNALEVGEESTQWRIPSQMLADILTNLPIGSGSTVTFTEEQNGWITMKCGRRRSKLNQITAGDFPHFGKFDSDSLQAVPDFTMRVKQAAWAADKSLVPWSGINITGEELIATDRYKLVRVPCAAPVDAPITVPMSILAPVLSSTQEMHLRVEERRLLLMPDPYTQIVTVIYDAEYPTIDRLSSAAREDFTHRVELDRQAFIDTLTSLNVVVKSEKYPRMVLTFEEGELHLFMQVPEKGEIEDYIEVDYDGDEPFVIEVTPQYLLQALSQSDRKKIEFGFGPDPRQTIGIFDDDQYRAWVMPRAGGSGASKEDT